MQESLDDVVRRIAREELRLLIGPKVATYSSTSLPPGISSREHFATECRRLGVGEKHGRVWVVEADAWRTARHERRASALPSLRVVRPEVERADAYLDALGSRATRLAG